VCPSLKNPQDWGIYGVDKDFFSSLIYINVYNSILFNHHKLAVTSQKLLSSEFLFRKYSSVILDDISKEGLLIFI